MEKEPQDVEPSGQGPTDEVPPYAPDLDLITYIEKSQKPPYEGKP